MYSRSLDPRRVPSALPNHYGGSAFRSDGTPTPIPVRREHDTHKETADPQNRPSSPSEEATAEDELLTEQLLRGEKPLSVAQAESPVDAHTDAEKKEEDCHSDGDGSFLSRLLGGFLPGVRDDDLLLILLIFLLSREEGNEDILLLLAILLFGN